MRPDLNFDDLEVKPAKSPGLRRAFILSGAALAMLVAVILVSSKVMSHLSSDGESEVAKIAEPEAVPEPVEPAPALEPEMVVAASAAIMDRPQDVELEIQIVEGESITLEGPDYATSPMPEGEEDAFAAFLAMEAESIRAMDNGAEELPDHTAAVLSDIELQLEPLNPLEDDLSQPVTMDHLLEPEITELEDEDDVNVGLVFSKPQGGDLTLNGKPIESPKPSLPVIKPSKLGTGQSDTKKDDSKPPFGGLFKSRDKKGEDSKNIWERSRED